MTCLPIAALGMLLCTAQPPFTANPDWDQPEFGQRLGRIPRPVQGMSETFETYGPAVARISGHLGFQIVDPGGDCRHRHRFMLAIRITMNGRQIDGTTATANVPRSEHYYDAPFYVVVPVEEGANTISVQAWMKPKDGGECRVYIKEKQYSRLQIEVLEALP